MEKIIRRTHMCGELRKEQEGKRAALNGLISMERYKSYVQIYEELKTAQHR